MKRAKKLTLLLILVLCISMILSGCGIIDSIYDTAEVIADLISDDSSGRNNDDDDDDDNSKPGNGHHGGGNVAVASIEEQYRLLVDKQNVWYVSRIDTSNYWVSYGISDLDNNGRIEVVQRIESIYAYDEPGTVTVYEVNERCDDLYEVEIEYNGEVAPDICDIYGGYETYDGIVYGTYVYDYYADAYMTYYVISMEDGVITGEVMKYATVDWADYDYSYYDANGNSLTSDEFYNLEIYNSYGGANYIGRYLYMSDIEDITYPNGVADGNDLYCFAEHGYNVFMNPSLSYETYDAELTIYTDPNSAEYQALDNVLVVNPGAPGVPVRFKMTNDMYFGLIDGAWSEELEYFRRDSYGDLAYYNRVYELNIDIPSDDEYINQIIICGSCEISVDEKHFGTYNGSYTIRLSEYVENIITEDSRFTNALAIVAYNVFKAGSVDKFTFDEDYFYETVSEVITYLYDYDDEIILPDQYYLDVMRSLFDWCWYYYYDYDTYDSSCMIKQHYDDYDNCNIFSDEYSSKYYVDKYVHYIIPEVDYSEAFEHLVDVYIYYDDDIPYDIDYIFTDGDGNNETISVNVYKNDVAFGICASYIY